jgi:hypothetical protein
MNKIFTTAAALTLLTATTASADFYFDGYAEYAFEAEQFETNLGINYEYSDFVVFADANLIDTADTDFTFDNAELGVGYNVTPNATVYGKVILDDNLEYDEGVVGLAFLF